MDSHRLQVLNVPKLYRVDVGRQAAWGATSRRVSISTNEPSCWDRLALPQPHTLRIAFRQIACPDQEKRVGKTVARYRIEMELEETDNRETNSK